MNKKRQEIETLKTYLLQHYDIDNDTFNLFLTFYKKDIKEKHILYKSNKYKLPCFDIESCTNDLPYDEEETNYDDDELIINLPDIDFEYEINQDFNTFKSLCLQDNMLDLYYNIKIDDFYRLFASNYNPVF